MSRIKDFPLRDEIIGEAALSLLQEKGPVNISSLIRKLQVMAAVENNRQRKQAIVSVLGQLMSNNEASLRRSDPAEEMPAQRNNVYSLFDVDRRSDATKKH